MHDHSTFRVAVVGTGPAAMYAVDHLLEQRGLRFEVDLIERLPTPWGLVRSGVAADHPDKKGIIDRHFAHLLRHDRVRFFGGVTVGEHVSAEELSQWYDAVIYAVGADTDARLDIPGEDLANSIGARAFVAWCNGHPDFSHLQPDFSARRAVIVGNGNVALDVARMLVSPIARLDRTDLADHALAALRDSRIEDVVVLGRRGAEHAAFNAPELEEFLEIEGVDVIVDQGDIARARLVVTMEGGAIVLRKLDLLNRLSARPRQGGRQLHFRFFASPVAIEGEGRVESVVLRDNAPAVDAARSPEEEALIVEAGLVVRSCGYRRAAFPGLPFDVERNVIANRAGRILADGNPVHGAYVTGWAKRGCKGIIGTNRKCAGETVGALIEDIGSGLVAPHAVSSDLIPTRLTERAAALVTRAGWDRIDRAERDAGRLTSRPRVKIVDHDELIRTAQTAAA